MSRRILASKKRITRREPEWKQILRRARKLLAKPGVWVGHAPSFAVGKHHCALTAIYKGAGVDYYAGNHQPTALKKALDAFRTVVGGGSIAYWNDSQHDVKDVLGAFDRAIALKAVPK